MRRTVSCTGRDFCSFALIDTKGSALALAERMQTVCPTETPLRVHWSGCSHGCGHHQVADVGLQATKTVRDGRTVDAVDVFLGGRLGIDARLAEPVLEAVPLTELPERLAGVLTSREVERDS
jgi:ferredoxin-nitrite reductase